MILGALAMTVAGALVTLTSQYNAAIGRRLGVLRTTFVFMTTGAVASLTIAVVARDGGAQPAPWSVEAFHLLPGLLNIASVAAVLVLVARQGAMLTTAGMFTGQVVTGLLLDSTGGLGVPLIHVTPLRILAASLLVVGVAVVVLPGRGMRGSVVTAQPSGSHWLLPGSIALGVVNGLMQAVNADLGLRIGVMYAVFLFLAPGAVILAVIAVAARLRGAEANREPWRFRPLYVLPGLMNVIVLSLSILLLPVTGLQVSVGAKFTANLFSSAMVDLFGAFGMPRYPLSPRRMVGLGCLVPGVILSVIR